MRAVSSTTLTHESDRLAQPQLYQRSPLGADVAFLSLGQPTAEVVHAGASPCPGMRTVRATAFARWGCHSWRTTLARSEGSRRPRLHARRLPHWRVPSRAHGVRPSPCRHLLAEQSHLLRHDLTPGAQRTEVYAAGRRTSLIISAVPDRTMESGFENTIPEPAHEPPPHVVEL